jgi:signal transduction histidine kinase
MSHGVIDRPSEQATPPAVSPVPDFRALFESAPGLYVVMTPTFQIVAASDGYLAATQTTRAAIVGRDFFEMFGDGPGACADGGARRVMASLQRVLSEGRPDVMPIEKLDVRWPSSRRAGLEERAWSRVNSPVLGPDGEVRYIVHRLEDVSKSIRLKEDFLAMLGHELRNPLAAIASATEILKRIGATAGLAGQSRAVIERQVRHLKRLVDDLLDAARVEGGKVTLERRPVDLAEAVRQALSTVHGIGGVQHAVEVDAEPTGVNVDPVRLEQILVSLLTNAVKFTPAGRAIRVRVAAEGDTAVLIIEDEGIGMSAEILPHIFDLFFQGERTAARTEGGLGIGLTLVKRLVEMHEGSVSASSDGPGRGAEFRIRLPAIRTKEAAIRPQAGTVTGATRRVLVVDDNVDAAESIGKILKLFGHDVRCEYDGQSALAAARDYEPDVVVLDIGLPGMDGYEVARELRALKRAKSPRIIAVTGYGQEEDRRRSRESGFDEHLTKPVDPEALQAFVGAAR